MFYREISLSGHILSTPARPLATSDNESAGIASENRKRPDDQPTSRRTHHNPPLNPPSPGAMCLITSPKNRNVRREYYDDAPRPVSNYHGGPQHHHHGSRSSRTYVHDVRRSSIPAERVSYRRSGDVPPPRVSYEPRRSHGGNLGREVDVVRTSRTYVR